VPYLSSVVGAFEREGETAPPVVLSDRLTALRRALKVETMRRLSAASELLILGSPSVYI